jgi:hypothetical protein
VRQAWQYCCGAPGGARDTATGPARLRRGWAGWRFPVFAGVFAGSLSEPALLVALKEYQSALLGLDCLDRIDRLLDVLLSALRRASCWFERP